MTNVSEQMGSNFRSLDASEIGSILVSSRRGKNISLQELSDNLRIPKMYLKCLENSDFGNLPGVAYVPGYIRSYCKFTGIDSSALVAAYIASVDNDDVNPIYEVPGQALVPKFSNSSIAMIAVFIAIFGYIGWFLLVREKPEEIASIPPVLESPPNKIEKTNLVSSSESVVEKNQINGNLKPNLMTPSSSDNAVTKDANSELVDNKKSPNEENKKMSELARAQNDPQLPAEVLDVETQIAKIESDKETQDIMKVSNSQSGIAVDQKAETLKPSSAVAKGIELSDTLTIKANASSWIEMVNSDGNVITSKLLRPGDSIAASLSDKLYLTTGNAGGLSFEMMDVPAFKIGKTGEIVRDLPLSADSILSRKFN